MADVKEIRRKLWHSLDMLAVKRWFLAGCILAGFTCLIVMLKMANVPGEVKNISLFGMLLITAAPFFVFCAWRTVRIFRKPESYIFCKTKLSNPKGGTIRDTIKFRVIIEDADGRKFVADTHSIFDTHDGLGGMGFENYVNQTVTVAYNEETDVVVVIG